MHMMSCQSSSSVGVSIVRVSLHHENDVSFLACSSHFGANHYSYPQIIFQTQMSPKDKRETSHFCKKETQVEAIQGLICLKMDLKKKQMRNRFKKKLKPIR